MTETHKSPTGPPGGTKGGPMLGRHHSDDTKKRMSESQRGENNPRWQGGRIKVKTRNGQDCYVYVLSPEHHSVVGSGSRYVAEHRLVMEKHLGRFLKGSEEVHHKNGKKSDNRIDNLELVTHANHTGVVSCPHCLKRFKIK